LSARLEITVGFRHGKLGGAPRAVKQISIWHPTVTATAHKLARLVYFRLTRGQAYVEVDQQYYEDHYRERVVETLSKRRER
jgi:hypothetical protein